MIMRKDLIIPFIAFLLYSIFCFHRCGGSTVLRWIRFVAMPTPQNMSTLQTTKCSVLGNLLELSRVSKTVLGNYDLWYMYDKTEDMPQEFFRLSTVECFQYPEVYFDQENLLAVCNKISKKSLTTDIPTAQNVTNISFYGDLFELDCSGVPFAKDICVPCKSCPAEVTCYVFTGTIFGSYTPQIPVVTERDAEGKSCIRGYKNGNCSNICDPGTYDYLCSKICSIHCVDGDCHHKNGTCLKGCNPGWKDDKCNVPDCPSNKFGPYCKYTCSPNCKAGCNSEDGTCVCKPGWKPGSGRWSYLGLLCNEPCEPGTWGDACRRECGDCLEGTVCHPENGTCPSGCNTPGYYLSSYEIDRCDYYRLSSYSKCRRTEYGINCEKNCSSVCLNSYCRNTDGICLNCPAGFRGPDCSIECTPGTFGENCNGKCRCENGAVCDTVSGRCPGKCIPGYEGTDCSQKACEPGTYGSDCDKWCFCKDNKPCDRKEGNCPAKDCQKGWLFSRCDYRDVCLFPPDDGEDESPITWEPGSLVIGIIVGIIVTVFIVVCRVGYKKFMKS